MLKLYKRAKILRFTTNPILTTTFPLKTCAFAQPKFCFSSTLEKENLTNKFEETLEKDSMENVNLLKSDGKNFLYQNDILYKVLKNNGFDFDLNKTLIIPEH